MAIAASDIGVYLSGGPSNTVADDSIGGAPSNTKVGSSSLHNLWDKVTGDESSAGYKDYRIVYIQNDHGTLEGENIRAYFQTNESSYLNIGVNQAKNTNAPQLTNEETDPSGVTWSAAANKAAAVSIGDLAAGDYRALYIRRTIPAGAPADDQVDWNIQIAVDTPA